MGSLRMLLIAVLTLLHLIDEGSALVSDADWAAYKSKYNKHYTFDDEHHRALYDKKVAAVESHNLKYANGQAGYFMKLNEFSDTDQNVLYTYRSSIPPPVETENDLDVTSNAPSNYKRYDEITDGIDWRQYGYISPVGNQGTECLSCWAFSSAGVLEAHLAKKTGRLVVLSQKHLVDCAPTPNNGCYGGWVSVAFNYSKDHGIASQDSYPSYKPRTDSCRYTSRSSRRGAASYHTLKFGDEKELAEVVYNIGPVAISINHLYQEFEEYGGGVLSIPNCTTDRLMLKHSMLVVGFGTDPTTGDYWLIKNSQGTSWGEDGYLRLARNAGNMCGVASLAQYPIVYDNNLA
ncbi:hypothetical protein KR054_003219 [Drosophila jambulina]|nr:hypothetical protein KR054_003219 [Drosophila jambulina]